jgi:hypothetical protein
LRRALLLRQKELFWNRSATFTTAYPALRQVVLWIYLLKSRSAFARILWLRRKSVLEINRRRRSIILTDGMERIGLAKASQIFLKDGRTDPVGQSVRDFIPSSHSNVHRRKYSALFWTKVLGNGEGWTSTRITSASQNR